METTYLICAVVGGTLIVCQFVMTLFGLGGDHDVGGHDLGGHDVGGHDFSGHDAHGPHGHDHGSTSHTNWFFGILTFRTVVAALAFFGLAGLAVQNSLDPLPTLGVALGAGFGALLIVGSIMRTMGRLNVDGTARIERSVGSTGTVYLTVPGGKAGAGKVHVSVHNRRVEYKAVTANDDLPTGAKVVVVGVVSSDTVEVSPVGTLAEKPSHA
jgi:hypothetical protein